MTARDPETPVPNAAAPAATEDNVPPVPGHPPTVQPAPEGAPEAVIAEAVEAHSANQFIQMIGQRLAKGLNFRAGACLADIRDLAYLVFLDGDGDSRHALAICRLIAELPYDGNPGRWTPIEACLALAFFITRKNGQLGLSAAYGEKLRAPDREEQDAFRAKINAQVRQRSLNEPNLYDMEIAKAAGRTDRKSELSWRRLRLDSLLQLLAHGGSQTLDDAELERRIGNELVALRSGRK